jgi:Tfp pilus assembly protein PilO
MLTQLLARTKLKPLLVDVIGAGIFLACLGLLGGLAYWPMLEDAARIERQAELDKALLNRAGQIQADHHILQAQLSEKLRLVKELEKRVPPSAQESDFFGQVATLSQEQGVTIHGFRPLSSAALVDYHVMKVAFDASAEYEPLCHFLDRLGKLPRLNHITRMHLAPQSQASRELTVKIETDIYFTAPVANGARS